MATANDKWRVYLLRCSDGSLYCGATKNIEKRLAAHNAGAGAKYTRSRLPVKLVCHSLEMSKSEAFRLEHKVKRTRPERKHLLLQPSE